MPDRMITRRREIDNTQDGCRCDMSGVGGEGKWKGLGGGIAHIYSTAELPTSDKPSLCGPDIILSRLPAHGDGLRSPMPAIGHGTRDLRVFPHTYARR